MKAIIYINQAQADAMETRLHAKLNAKGKAAGYLATQYSGSIVHPTDGRVAIPIESRFMPWWREIQDELTPVELDSIEELTSDWFATEL